jgi:hypothetical protein
MATASIAIGFVYDLNCVTAQGVTLAVSADGSIVTISGLAPGEYIISV